MYPQTLYSKTRQVLNKLKNLELVSQFYLAGGTALALQLGHRKSIDLDFFTADFPKRDLLIESIKSLKPKIIQEAPNTIDLTIEGVKVSFLEYKYPLLEPYANFENVQMASVLDLACMKLSAVSSRGSKKDFADFYFILKKYSLDELLEAFEKKFKGVKFQKLHLLKSLSYFADAQSEPDPDFVEKISWEKITGKIEEKVKKYLKFAYEKNK